MKILITGFNPFGNESVNPAFEAVKLLPNEIKNAEIVKLEIPTEFKRAGKVLQEGIEANKPDVVICVGQAGGRSAITPEFVGINMMDGRIPDNAGYQPFDTPVREDGPAAYFATIPVKAMVQNIREAGIPAFVSYTAGTYVCNFLLYELMYQIAHYYPEIKGGFIHVPFMTEQAVNKANGTPSMELNTISKGLEKAVEAVIDNEQDIELHTGDTH